MNKTQVEEFVKTPSNDSDDEDKTKITDKAEGDEDEEMDYTTSQLYDDVDIRLSEPVDTDKGFVQEEGTDAVMTDVQQGNKNPMILQVIEDDHLTLSTIPQKTKVPVTSYSHSSDLAAKSLNFSDIPHTDAKIVSPMDVHIHHEYSLSLSHNHYHPLILHHNNQHPHHHQLLKLQILHLHFLVSHQSSNSTTESQHWKKKLLSSKRILSTLNKSYLAAPEHRESNEGLIKSYELDTTIFSTYGKVCSLNRIQKDKDEDLSDGSDRGLKKRKTSKDAEPGKCPKAKES
nr:hypothetical protein [Tanacetum cinerariifolium]